MSNRSPDEPTVVCAWCGKVTIPGSAEISHGICGKCAWMMLDESGMMDGDDGPVARSAREAPATPHPLAT